MKRTLALILSLALPLSFSAAKPRAQPEDDERDRVRPGTCRVLSNKNYWCARFSVLHLVHFFNGHGEWKYVVTDKGIVPCAYPIVEAGEISPGDEEFVLTQLLHMRIERKDKPARITYLHSYQQDIDIRRCTGGKA